ncbi:E3 ubiquitin-protein ligase SIAH1B-like isoform X2 [Fopius arisanus]|nr:PREDICTED: E3 ubiquitin-protein ligase SIAH1B-like isoform X2 [Fopius arisanus]
MNNNEIDVMTELRAYWCHELEELMECPVCLDVPQGSIYQCIEGHDICQYCKKIVDMCPICKKPFNEGRNYTVEKIIAKFQDIKLSLMEPENDINKYTIQLKKSVGTQTTEPGGGV